mgnify:CR=1 FL=1|jgi:hypothetical protein|nr:MAG TPA: hypothetical protein [Caudoviricetes sp.]
MDINESIQRMNRITNKLSRSLNPTISVQNQIAQSVAPLIEYQEQVRQSVAPLIEYQEQVRQSMTPFIEYQEQVRQSMTPFINYQEQVRQSIAPFIDYLDNISLNLNSSMQQFVSYQQDILETISRLNFDISSSYISTESSIEFSQIVSDVLDEFNDIEIDEFIDSNQKISTCTSSKRTLTWEQIFVIILGVLEIISFVQDQLPNSHLINMEKAIYQIIEIEKQQLNLLEELINK